MAHFSGIWSSFLVLSLLTPGALSWTFLWRNESTTSRVLDGQSAQNCTQVWHQEGEGFSWDPEGPWCIKLYSDGTCDHSNGISCEGYLWRQVASQNISAISIYPMPPASVTAFGFASTTLTPTASPTPTESSAEETPATETSISEDIDIDTHGGLSAGEIAGIVVGVVAALILACAAFFFLGRRMARKAAAAAAAASASDSPPSNPPPTQPSNVEPSSPTSENLSSSPTLQVAAAELPKPPTVDVQDVPAENNQPPNGTRMIELPGPIPGGELSNSRQLQEMAVTYPIQELEGRAMGKSGS